MSRSSSFKISITRSYKVKYSDTLNILISHISISKKYPTIKYLNIIKMVRQIKKGITYSESKDADLKVRATVEGMLAEVGERGDAAVRELSTRLDKWCPENFRLSKEQIEDIIANLPEQVIEDIKFAQTQIRN